MIIETPVLPFGQWLTENLPVFLLVLIAAVVAGAFVGYLMSALRYGPAAAFRKTWQAMAEGVRELRHLSGRRVVAMARLAFQESIRNKVLIAFVLLLILLLFGGWFLDRQSDTPERLYLSFVLQSTNYLILIPAIFLSAFSLPNDLKYRTIYTVVTKPVRAWEIVLGRMIGFSAMGTLLIGLMCVASYVFVVRGLSHTHDVDLASVRPTGGSSDGPRPLQGRTTINSPYRNTHRHNFSVNEEGVGSTDTAMNHWHEVTRIGEGEDAKFTVSTPRGGLQARVPILGKLRFLDREGKPAERGISVGKEWGYRGYIDGGTNAAAIWTFEGVTPGKFRRGLPLEMTIRVFRTYIGDIERGITGTIVLRNPATGMESTPTEFVAREFTPNQIFIEREMKRRTPDGRLVNIDLHDDLVHEGSVEVRIQCLERSQLFGMAPADLYLRAEDSWFWLNFAKGYLSIWFQMLLVTGFGVMFSTFLSGAVAMLATLSTMVAGFFTQFIVDVATGAAEGGGPVEATIRIFKQMNLVTPLDQTVSTTVVQGVDLVMMRFMRAVAYVLPDYASFSTTRFVAYGYDVPGSLVAQQFAVAVAYSLVVACAGYFLLKSREIAA